jgi:hypothetical protein
MAKMYARGVSQADGSGPARMSPGDYEFECTGAEEIVARSGKPGFNLTLRVIDGPEDEKGNSVADKVLSNNRVYIGEDSDKDGGTALQERVRNTCDAFGVPIDDDDSFDLDEFVGARARGKMKPQKSNPDFLEVAYFYTE